MKLTFITILSVIWIGLVSTANAQSEKELKKQVEEKAIKDARQEAKVFLKEKWFAQPGSLPLDKQIEKAWMKQYETNNMGYRKYYVGIGKSAAISPSKAKNKASYIAKQDLISIIQTNIISIIQNNLSSTQFTEEETINIQETISTSTAIIAQNLEKIITLSELYRKDTTYYQCDLRIACSAELANEAAKKAIKKSLSENTRLAQEKLDLLISL